MNWYPACLKSLQGDVNAADPWIAWSNKVLEDSQLSYFLHSMYLRQDISTFPIPWSDSKVQLENLTQKFYFVFFSHYKLPSYIIGNN